jgi:hypothetical protein
MNNNKGILEQITENKITTTVITEELFLEMVKGFITDDIIQENIMKEEKENNMQELIDELREIELKIFDLDNKLGRRYSITNEEIKLKMGEIQYILSEVQLDAMSNYAAILRMRIQHYDPTFNDGIK